MFLNQLGQKCCSVLRRSLTPKDFDHFSAEPAVMTVSGRCCYRTGDLDSLVSIQIGNSKPVPAAGADCLNTYALLVQLNKLSCSCQSQALTTFGLRRDCYRKPFD